MTNKFHAFAKAVEANFRAMSADELFVVEADDIFETYLSAFPEGTNPIFRERTEHDCSCCKNFIRHAGKVVSLKGGNISTVWDGLDQLEFPYNAVAADLAHSVRSQKIQGVFRTKERTYGSETTHEHRGDGVHTWHHFFCRVANRHYTTSPEADRGNINTTGHVFKRGLEELNLSDLETVADLIKAKALYRGEEHKAKVDAFLKLHRAYAASHNKDVFIWEHVSDPAARFRNDVIGTLVVDLSSGVELTVAVGKFESKVAPQNYKRPTALITPRMIEQATNQLKELGLESAVERRFAKLSDVSVNNVLFVDNSVRGDMKDGLAGLLMQEVKPATVDVKNAEPISIDDFLSRIVPQATSIDLLLQNTHLSNFMSLTAPVHSNVGQLFKWDNNFAWSYEGDATDSIKERVKRAGGNIDAPLRVSLAWYNSDDLDLHAHFLGHHVYFSNKGGVLDVDMNGMDRHDAVAPVENLSWQNYKDGDYRIVVHQFQRRNTDNPGFEVEFFFNGETKLFTFNKMVAQGRNIELFTFSIKKGVIEKFKANPELTQGFASQSKWGVNTETLVPVNTLLASPNHWDEQTTGNKHWFFILKDCLNPDSVRGIYNEFLRGSLEQHRKVFEVLGAKTKAAYSPDQLSGVGFSSSRDNEATVVVKGSRINQAFRIKF